MCLDILLLKISCQPGLFCGFSASDFDNVSYSICDSMPSEHGCILRPNQRNGNHWNPNGITEVLFSIGNQQKGWHQPLWLQNIGTLHIIELGIIKWDHFFLGGINWSSRCMGEFGGISLKQKGALLFSSWCPVKHDLPGCIFDWKSHLWRKAFPKSACGLTTIWSHGWKWFEKHSQLWDCMHTVEQMWWWNRLVSWMYCIW